jgi:geranylgeranyl diphosphate synthase type I
MNQDNEIFNSMTIEVEKFLKGFIESKSDRNFQEYFEIIAYQMGWSEQTNNQGKRVRPLLVLSVIRSLGGNWKKALPAACAIELLHNYSLIHDDIEDKSFLRRGKDTVWVKWGEAQAINSGDGMQNLAFQAIWQLEKEYSPLQIMDVQKVLQNSSLELTKGQFLDISFETRHNVSMDEYFLMIYGKTGSLIKAAFEIGAILGNADPETKSKLIFCAESLGKAYQIQDDWLGIWGDELLTGKSTKSDLAERKKTYPTLLGLENKGRFAEVWNNSTRFASADIDEMRDLLDQEGIKKKCEDEFDRCFNLTIDSLSELQSKYADFAEVKTYVTKLLRRRF